MAARLWGFESPLRHSLFLEKSRLMAASRAVTSCLEKSKGATILDTILGTILGAKDLYFLNMSIGLLLG